MNRNKGNLKREPNPYNSANILSKWSFWWLRNLFRKGLKRPLEEQEMYEHRDTLDSGWITEKIFALWEDELQRKGPSVLRLLFRAYGLQFIGLGLAFCIIETCTRVAQPLCLGGLVAYFVKGQTHTTLEEAYLYAGGIVLCALLPVLTFHPFIFYIFQIGTKMRVGCSGLIYKKILRISKSAINEGLTGKAINILSNDLGKFDIALCFFHDLWKGPAEAILLGYFMYQLIGFSAILGVAFMLSFIPLQGWIAKKAAHYRQKTAERTDFRVKLMNEIIHGVQVIKMYAWEKSFASVIDKVRRKEINAIRGSVYIYSALHTTVMISKFSVFISLVSYAYWGDEITAQRIFTVSSFFNMLNDSLVHFWPLAVTFCAEAYVSTKRTTEFLLESESKIKTERQENMTQNILVHLNGASKPITSDISKEIGNPPVNSRRKVNLHAAEKGLQFTDATALWGNKNDGEKQNVAISDFNLNIKEKELAAVVGSVGAGKTSLLNVILGEVELTGGELNISGTISYAAQEPWLFEGTVRDNILFTEEFDEVRYKNVCYVCALDRDIKLFPFGDMTIVGERGVSLSGGQKARVSLARAVYRKADIYLLDDPLSAVDAHVGKHIFDLCIRKFLSDKTRVLITHQLQYLKDVQHLILMKAGQIKAQGSYQALSELNEFKYLAHARDEAGEGALKRSESVDSKTSKDFTLEDIDNDQDDRKEVQAIGSVKFGVYKSYFKALESPCILTFIFTLFIIVRVMLTGVEYFISRWAIWEEAVANFTHAENDSAPIVDVMNPAAMFMPIDPTLTVNQQRENIIVIYTVFLTSAFLLYLARTYGFFIMCLRISLKLHDKLFRGITRAPMLFFNTNPSGRILNRFSKDIYSIDGLLPEALIDCLSFFTDVTGVLVIVVIANYWLLVPTLVVTCLFYLLRFLYINTSRSVKRIESITRSPVYSHTNQTINGLTTIRALQAESQLEREFHEHQNANTSVWFMFLSTTRAFALWLDFVCVLYIAAVTFSFLILSDHFYSGDVGLAIMQCITMVGMCQWGMRQTAELENQMTSVERVIEYAEQPQEPPLETSEKYQLPKDWPSEGQIEFNKLSLSYSENDDPVLKELDFVIRPTEKIGIVGRTGAGKSSIIQALFRLANNEGVIKIDNVDISTIGLHDLRSKISIIPQDPVLFFGTLRYNLDPFEQKSDAEMWRALEDVELKEYVSSLVGGLNCKVSDGGSNFSMGQRQLVCLARAILRNNKILILDEATANVDPETDKLIQTTIRKNFNDCTVLTIAHRLHTIMDNDRVFVMDAGRLVEVGHSHELLQVPNGYFRKLVEQTGAATAKVLSQAAESSFKDKKKCS